MPFIQSKNDIPRNCFISSEAVWWCIAHIDEIVSEADAIQLMQVMRDFEVIRHISPSQKVFIHGFYLYYIVTENINAHAYTKDYLEVGFCDIEHAQSTCFTKSASDSLFAVKDLLPEAYSTLPITWNETLEAYQSLFGEYSRTEFAANSKKYSHNAMLNANQTNSIASANGNTSSGTSSTSLTQTQAWVISKWHTYFFQKINLNVS